MTPRILRRSSSRAGCRRAISTLLAACAMLAASAAPALAGTANAGLPGASPTDPLAGMAWGHYTGTMDGVYPAWQGALGAHKQLLAKIALRPLAYWFGSWFADSYAPTAAREYIASETGGNPNVLAQMAVFRLDNWEQAACTDHPSAAAQASYRRWVDNFAAGIGASRVALILQPDLAFALCAPTRVPLQLVAYAARRFAALPHTTVYIDGGVHWFPMRATQAVSMLEQAGIRYARGFALNTTEYDATGAELTYGAGIVRALQAAGYGTKHMVINTAENGSPFLNGQYHGDIGNPRVCASRHAAICATLGIPPTSDVANRHWGLTGAERSVAAHYADAYLWIGRPWLDYGSKPLDLNRAFGLAASSPF
jgi:endoglucanase